MIDTNHTLVYFSLCVDLARAVVDLSHDLSLVECQNFVLVVEAVT